MSNPTRTSETGRPAPPVNLIAGRSQVVHAPNPIYPDIPSCRTFSQGAGGRPHYRVTTAPVTCKNCGPDRAATPTPVEPPSAATPADRVAQAVRPCARTIHAALARAGVAVERVRVTTGRQRCVVRLSDTLQEHGPERAQAAEDAIRRLWSDSRTRVWSTKGDYHWLVYIYVADYWKTTPMDLVDLCHAAALREDEERTPAPAAGSAEFPAGLRLRNPQTGASFEVIEHTHAVRLRNLRTDAVSAVPQDMAREFERLPSEQAQRDPEDIRARIRAEDAARFEAALREGIAAVVRTVEALAPVLLQFARDPSLAGARLAELFGTPHPNACALCGQGEGPRDHWGSSHDYRPPVDVVRLRRMQLRRTAEAPARDLVRAAHQEWRAAVRLTAFRARLRRDRSYWTERYEAGRFERQRSELERAGLMEVPFDQQGVQPDASAFPLPS